MLCLLPWNILFQWFSEAGLTVAVFQMRKLRWRGEISRPKPVTNKWARRF